MEAAERSAGTIAVLEATKIELAALTIAVEGTMKQKDQMKEQMAALEKQNQLGRHVVALEEAKTAALGREN